jgi:hypothetical protein
MIAFDFVKFKNEIIPAFIEGEQTELIQEEIRIQNSNNLDDIPAFANLQLVTRLLNPDFRGEINSLKQIIENELKWNNEELSLLFESSLIRKTAKYFASIGKIYNICGVLSSFNPRLQHLIELWGNSGKIWQHRMGGFGEGIAGWISPLEVEQLFENKHQIQFNKENLNIGNQSFETIVGLWEICCEENLGLLYGNDLVLNLKPAFQYNLILELKILENENWDGYPTFMNEILKDYR